MLTGAAALLLWHTGTGSGNRIPHAPAGDVEAGRGHSSHRSTDGVRARAESLPDTLDAFIQRALEAAGHPAGFAATVVVDTARVFLRGYGAADMAAGEAVDPSETAFYIASSTKSFTGMAAAVLDHRGELDLDAPVARYLPEIALPQPLDPAEITIRDLLTHTSGIDNTPLVIRTAYTGLHDRETLLRVLEDHTSPGSDSFQYANEGYVVASLAMDALGEGSWKEILARELFRPLGMDRTTAYVSLAEREGWPLARPYTGITDDSVEVEPYLKADETMHAAGGLLTTADDLARWVEVNLNQGRLDGRQVLPAAAVREAHREQVSLEAGFYKFRRYGYGLGWYHADYEDDLLMHHFGSFSAFRAHVSFMPEHGIGVATLAAQFPAGFALADLAATFAYDYLLEKPDLNARYDERLAEFVDQVQERRKRIREDRANRASRTFELSHPRQDYTGTYRSPAMGTAEIRLREDGTLVFESGQVVSVMEPFTETDALRIDVAGNGDVIQFFFSGPGPADSLRAIGRPFRRVEESPDVGRVADYLSRLEAFGLAGGVLVAVDGEILLARGYGLADRGDGEETGDGGPVAPRPWTAGTVSSVGSITKQFTAAAIMALAEENRLSVGDSIGAFFDGVPADKRGITLHHLLTHTSGLDELAAGDFDYLSRREIVEHAMASELLWEPGAEYRYSNLGYSLLGAVVEVVTGEDYEAWIREHLFRPAGMYETGYVLPDYEPARVATGYRAGDRWGTVIERLDPDRGPSWVLRANGGIHTTLHDMHRWVQELGAMEMHAGSEEIGRPRRAGVGDAGAGHLLSRESRERMFAPQADEGVGSWYGYGWVVDTTSRGTPILWHNGGNGILHADLHLFPAEGVETFMMTSAADLRATSLLSQVDAVLFGGDVEMPPAVDAVDVPPSRLADLAGRYRIEGGGTLEVASVGNALVVHAYGQEAVDALWRGEPVGSVDYTELNRRAARFARAFAEGDYDVIRSLMGTDAPEEPYREFRDRTLEQFGPLGDVEVLGTVPAWFHGGSAEATWLRLRFGEMSTVRRVHWSSDGELAGIGGEVYPAPLSLRCAMTAAGECIGWHEGLETRTPRVTFGLAGGEQPGLTVWTEGGGRLRAVREGS